MKSPICHLCKTDFGSEHFHFGSGGALVQFADYKPLPEGAVGHPHGLEWFCSEHLEVARTLTALLCADAMSKLKEQFGEFPPFENGPLRDPALWVTSIGPNAPRVFAIIRQAMSISPADAKGLLALGQFKVIEGWPSQFKTWQQALTEAGATVEIRFQ